MWVTQTLGEVFHLVWPSSLTEVIALRLNFIEEKSWKLNTSIGPLWILQHPYQVPVTHSTARHKIFCTLRYDLHTDYTSTTLHTPLGLLYSYLCGSMSFTSDTWGFRQTRVLICAWLPNLRLLWWASTERPGAGAGCLWSTMGKRGGHNAPVTQKCGDLKGRWGFPPCGNIWAVMSVEGNYCKCEHIKVCIPIKFY